MLPAALAISFIGVYVVDNNPFDLLLMAAFGLMGYLMRKLDFPLAPVLGYLTETNLRRAMTISSGDLGYPFSSLIAIGLWVLRGSRSCGPC